MEVTGKFIGFQSRRLLYLFKYSYFDQMKLIRFSNFE